MTGSVTAGGVAAVIEPVCNVPLLPLHEWLWRRLRAVDCLKLRQAHAA